MVEITALGYGRGSLLYSIDQDLPPLAIKSVVFREGVLYLGVSAIDGVYKGKMSPDGATITGTWIQPPGPLPLVLVRSTPATEWAIPDGRPPSTPMSLPPYHEPTAK